METILLFLAWVAASCLVALTLHLTSDTTRHARAYQHHRLLTHKWYESEKAGHDIGIRNAKKSFRKIDN